MKNYFIAVAAVSLLTMSCKKDHTCDCTVTTDGTTTTHTQTAEVAILGFTAVPASDTTTYQPFHTVNTVKTTYTKVSNSTMRASCYSKSEETLNDNSTNTTPGTFTVTTSNTGVKTYDCKIE